MSELLPAVRGEMMPADVLVQYERLAAIVGEQRRRRAEEEEQAREQRSREWEQRQITEHLFLNAGRGDQRRLERLALSEAGFEEWRAIEGEINQQLKEAEARFQRECARIRQAGSERQAEAARAHQAKADALMASHRRDFERELPGLLKKLEAARARAIQGEPTPRALMGRR